MPACVFLNTVIVRIINNSIAVQYIVELSPQNLPVMPMRTQSFSLQ